MDKSEFIGACLKARNAKLRNRISGGNYVDPIRFSSGFPATSLKMAFTRAKAMVVRFKFAENCW